MSASQILEAFPKRALHVHVSIREKAKIFFGVFVSLAMLASVVFFTVTYTPGIIRDAHLAKSGELAELNDLSGACRVQISILMFTTCDFNIAYTVSDGQPRKTRLTALLFGGLNQDTKPQVKVNPEDPSQLSLSWFADVTTDRWLTLAGICLIFIFLGGILIFAAMKSISELRLYQKLAKNPKPIITRINSLKSVSSPEYAHKYTFSYDTGAGERVRTQTFHLLPGNKSRDQRNWRYEEPLFLESHTEALALIDTAGNALLVKRSFSPLILTEAERETIYALQQNNQQNKR